MICDICHNPIITRTLDDINVIKDHIVCNHCKESNFDTCVECGEPIFDDNFIDQGNHHVCYDCLKNNDNFIVKNCHLCNKKILVVSNPFRIAPYFLFAETYTCYSHQNLDGIYFCYDCKQHRCCEADGCYNLREENSNYCSEHYYIDKIHSYGYKPDTVFYTHKENCEVDDTKDIYIGVELEINFNTAKDRNSFLNNLKSDFFYCKRDGSLDTYGIEIVSHPATIFYHVYSEEWKRLFDELNKYQVNTKNCGLHFHISKKPLDENAIKHIDFFVNNYTKIINDIGSRYYNQYAKCCRSFNRCYTHYDACNLSNSNTVEIRFCKSTYNYSTFMKKLKSIFAIVVFCTTFKEMKVDYDLFNKVKAEILSLF